MTRLALVGYGRIAPKHLEAFRALGAEFVACCNRSSEGRRKAEQEGGIPRTYARIDEMLERERPDGVVCCASMQYIHGAALEILPFQIPTLLEKPPGTSLAEFHQLSELADRTGTPVMVALNRRHYSVVGKAVADAGGFDNITAVSVEWSEDPGHFLQRGFSREEVSRMVFGNTLHGLDLLTYLAGAIDDPAVTGMSRGEPLRWMMALQGVSQRGALVSFNSSWDSPGRWRVSFCSPNRRYVFAPLETCQVSETGLKETRAIEPDEADLNFKPGFLAQATAFLQAIECGQVSPKHGLASAEPAIRLAELLTNACAGAKSNADSSERWVPMNPAASRRKKRPLRIIVLGDSLVMARDNPLIVWEDTWPARLSDELRDIGVDAEIVNCGARARTADRILGNEFFEHIELKRPDLVILHIGITDCAPRLFTRRQRNLLNQRFVPQWLRDWIIRSRGARRQQLLKKHGPLSRVYTPPADFAACLERFGHNLSQFSSQVRVIVLPITCNQSAMDQKSPGHGSNVKLYNSMLKEFANRLGARWVDPAELFGSEGSALMFAADGYHWSTAGSARCASVIAPLIPKNTSLTFSVAEGVGRAGQVDV